jgi:hypothetical protein
MGEAAGDRVLSRLHSIRERIGDSLSAHPNELVAVFTRLIFLPCKLLPYFNFNCCHLDHSSYSNFYIKIIYFVMICFISKER